MSHAAGRTVKMKTKNLAPGSENVKDIDLNKRRFGEVLSREKGWRMGGMGDSGSNSSLRTSLSYATLCARR